MSAREMFEKLGYKEILTQELNNELIRITYKNKSSKYGEETIEFNNFEKQFMKNIVDYMNNTITVLELKAIQQQIKELGWDE